MRRLQRQQGRKALLSAVRRSLFDRFLKPLEKRAGEWVGVELEFPIVRCGGGPADPMVAHELLGILAGQLSLSVLAHDRAGRPISVAGPSGDRLSFEYSTNTLELSLARRRSLGLIDDAYEKHFGAAAEILLKRGHMLVGMGVHPYAGALRTPPLDTSYYRMINAFLSGGRAGALDSRSNFNAVICSSQTHLDVPLDRAALAVQVFSALEWLKALLFANSAVWEGRPDPGGYYCARDRFWAESRFAVNPLNVGPHDGTFARVEDLIEYDLRRSIFYVKRGARHLFFEPVPLRSFFAHERISASFVAPDGTCRRATFVPRLSDLETFRGYKHLEITPRGTFELRGECQQPVSEVLAPAAFNVGVLAALDGVGRELAGTAGGSNSVARRLAARGRLPAWTDRVAVRRLLLRVLEAARRGLASRGLGEDRYLLPLFVRAERLSNPASAALAALRKTGDLVAVVENYGRSR